jgi:hypothetical protein
VPWPARASQENKKPAMRVHLSAGLAIRSPGNPAGDRY